MTAKGRKRELPQENPFSSPAIAIVSDESDPYTLDTGAMNSAIECMDTYLMPRSSTATGPMSVIAVIGEYGTGKTHIADVLLKHAKAKHPTAYGIYVDAPQTNFLALYKNRFITQLNPEQVWDRVQEHYSDVIAEYLESSPLSATLAGPLRDRSADPRTVVHGFSLPENVFQDGLRTRLRNVTETDDFSTVLALAIQPGFADAIWSWLSGGEPHEILRDRGVTTKIDSVTLALEAIGVFALLFGSLNRKFIVVIDELERLLVGRPPDDVAEAFEKLLAVFRGSGAFLVLAGLPDFLEALPSSARERVDRIIETLPFTEEQTRKLIIGLRERATGKQDLVPFSDETVSYVVKLCGGVVRKIIKLCNSAYNAAYAAQSDVTPRMIEQAAGQPSVRVEDAHAEIRKILQRLGNPVDRNIRLGDTESSRADFWVRVGDLGAGCALILAETILTQDDVDAYAARAAALRSVASHREALLVVAGFLAANLAEPLRNVFDAEPLVYEDKPRFTDNFLLWVNESIKRVAASAEVETMRIIHDQVDLISVRQADTQNYLGQLAVHLDNLRASSDRQLGTINRILQEVVDPASRTQQGHISTTGLRAHRLPDDIAADFERAFAAVDDIRRIDTELGEVFSSPNESAMIALGRRGMLRDKLSNGSVIEAAGVAALLQRLLEAFSDGIWRWLDDLAGRPASPRDEKRLRTMCDTFEMLFEALPTYRLDPLVDLSGVGEREDHITTEAVISRRRDVRDAFDGFAGRVFLAARTSAAARAAN